MSTPVSHVRAHLSEVCRWSAEGKIEAAEIVVAALGMAIPVLLAAISGDLAPGFAAAIGSLAVGRIEIAAGFRTQLRREAEALAPAMLAALLAVMCAGRGWLTDAAEVALVGMAATLSGFSRAMVVAATRFILFLMIVSAVATPTQTLGTKQAMGFLTLVVVGALWTSTLSLVLWAVVRRSRRETASSSSSQPTPTFRQKYERLRRSFKGLAGWSYPIRLAPCIAIAAALDATWPNHHLHWVGLTAAILTQRQIELVPVKTTQRVLGTAMGVTAAGITLRSGLPSWAFVAAIGILGGVRPVLRVKNYLAYSAVMTPLIILIIDAGHAPDGGLLLDRLIATLLGAALVVGANMFMFRLISDREPNS